MNSNMNPAKAPSWLSREKQESSERREGVERLAENLKSKRSLLLWTAVESMVALGTLYLVFFQLPAIFSPSPQIVTSFTYPFSTQFTFFNEGYFSAHEIRGACELNSVSSASKTVKHVFSGNWVEIDTQVGFMLLRLYRAGNSESTREGI